MASWRNPGYESSTIEDAGGELYFFLQVNVLFSKNEQTIQVIFVVVKDRCEIDTSFFKILV